MEERGASWEECVDNGLGGDGEIEATAKEVRLWDQRHVSLYVYC